MSESYPDDVNIAPKYPEGTIYYNAVENKVYRRLNSGWKFYGFKSHDKHLSDVIDFKDIPHMYDIN